MTPAMPLWPLVVYFGAVLVLVAGILGLSYILGQRHREPQTGQPFESGVLSTGSARIRWDVRYYRVAMFFVVFDLEAAFLFAWAIAARALGWPGYIEVVIFVAVLFAALIYLWRVGALDWTPVRRAGLSVERRLPPDELQPSERPWSAPPERNV
jgi:NADH-quinone oxidoreductase subunit A